MNLSLSDFDYPLADDRIAQSPLEKRDACRLLFLDRHTGAVRHGDFSQILEAFEPGDLLVLNNTKVLRARLRAHDDADRKFEVLLLSPRAGLLEWECMVKPAKKLKKNGGNILFPENVQAHLERIDDYLWKAQFSGIEDSQFHAWLERHGELPLPPYIRRNADVDDSNQYQTVFAQVAGSVAAPTAGLHFTPELLKQIEEKGVEIAHVTLHVGYGTFSPIRTENLSEHQMHHESFEVAPEVWEKIQQTKKQGKKVFACGTTVVRTLESISAHGLRGSTNLFIQPGYKFQVVDKLITNFHLPKSSLLVLVSAFAGKENIFAAYQNASSENYRFFSYGDAMLIH